MMSRLRALTIEQVRDLPSEVTIIDVRDRKTFAAGHLARSGNVPLDEFEDRRTELPARTTRVLVVADDARSAQRAAEELVARDFRSVGYLDGALGEVPGGLDDTREAVRLWRPSPFLESVLPALPRGRAADLAAGSGRDSVFLALHGFSVESWDHDEGGLAKATALAARHGVAIATIVCDLEQAQPPLPAGRYDLVVCVRFLRRALFPVIERALKPGGHLVYETFRAGQERFGKPRKPQHLLETGELATAFDALTVVRYEETEPEGGPWMARLLARKH